VYELADIFRQHGERYRATRRLPRQQLRVMRAIELCRTSALGGHAEKCSRCDYARNSYNSCRDRHCPKCQGADRFKWLESRQGELLPVEYFHVVFTLPEPIARIAFYNQKTVYGILFRAAAETLLTIARDPKHLGAEIGFFGILHTWGQNLLHHPHVHFVVPGGGIAPNGQWVGCRPGFFLPVRVLSRLFRRLFLAAIHRAFENHQLEFFGELASLKDPVGFRTYLDPLRDAEWVVYAKKPFGGPQTAIQYLARYTHRVALSNDRILDVSQGRVTFRWKDYRCKDRHKTRTMTLDAEEFIRRFLIHTLPPGFQRIRYFGLMANRHRKDTLARCRQLLASEADQLLPSIAQCQAARRDLKMREPDRCPQCRAGILVRVALIATTQSAVTRAPDTS
jgi:predicted Zn-ribbon and HTH transcriptional regulator